MSVVTNSFAKPGGKSSARWPRIKSCLRALWYVVVEDSPVVCIHCIHKGEDVVAYAHGRSDVILAGAQHLMRQVGRVR